MYYGYQITEQQLQHVERIGILAWGLIGDVFFRVPIIEAVKQRFPQAQITVIVDPAGKAVVQNHPAVSEVLVFSRSKKPLWKYIVHTLRNVLYLRRKKFDLFINLYSGGSSPAISRLTNARIRLGFDHTRALRKANNLLVHTPSFCQHWTRALGVKLEPLGIGADQIRRGSSYYIPQAAFAATAKYQIDPARHIAINLGAGRREKCWSVSNYARLAEYIATTYHYIPVVFTNPGMEALAEEFAAAYPQPYIRLPLLSLDEVAAIMQHCKAVITGDTSLMHLAIALKVPNLVLFTDTRPEIVEPDDCLHVPCFIEDPHNINRCGLPAGTPLIPLEYAQQCLAELMQKIDQPK